MNIFSTVSKVKVYLDGNFRSFIEYSTRMMNDYLFLSNNFMNKFIKLKLYFNNT